MSQEFIASSKHPHITEASKRLVELKKEALQKILFTLNMRKELHTPHLWMFQNKTPAPSWSKSTIEDKGVLSFSVDLDNHCLITYSVFLTPIELRFGVKIPYILVQELDPEKIERFKLLYDGVKQPRVVEMDTGDLLIDWIFKEEISAENRVERALTDEFAKAILEDLLICISTHLYDTTLDFLLTETKANLFYVDGHIIYEPPHKQHGFILMCTQDNANELKKVILSKGCRVVKENHRFKRADGKEIIPIKTVHSITTVEQITQVLNTNLVDKIMEEN